MIDSEVERRIEEAAERAALKALDVLMLHVGIDVNDTDEIKAFRERLECLKRMERGARETKHMIKQAAIKTCLGALIMGLLTLLGMGIKDWIYHVPKP